MGGLMLATVNQWALEAHFFAFLTLAKTGLRLKFSNA